jgi:hypothetical protein
VTTPPGPAALVVALEGLARDFACLPSLAPGQDVRDDDEAQAVALSCDAAARKRRDEGPHPRGLGPCSPFPGAGRNGACGL